MLGILLITIIAATCYIVGVGVAYNISNDRKELYLMGDK